MAQIKYNPSPENYDFLVDVQAEKKKVGPTVGLDRIVDQLVTEAKNRREATKQGSESTPATEG